MKDFGLYMNEILVFTMLEYLGGNEFLGNIRSPGCCKRRVLWLRVLIVGWDWLGIGHRFIKPMLNAASGCKLLFQPFAFRRPLLDIFLQLEDDAIFGGDLGCEIFDYLANHQLDVPSCLTPLLGNAGSS